MNWQLSASCLAGLALLAAIHAGTALAGDENNSDPAKSAQAISGEGADSPMETVDDEIITGAIMTESDMLQYCVNIQDTARESRYAFLKSKLDESRDQLEDKIVLLTDRLAEMREYVERREKFLDAVDEKLTAIFESMRADAAAEQLSQLDTGLAASIVAKLDTSTSSQILTEMAPRNAAAIAQYLSAATRRPSKPEATQ